LDGLPSEWGEYEPYPPPYKRRTGWYWVADQSCVGIFPCTGKKAGRAKRGFCVAKVLNTGGAGGKYGIKNLNGSNHAQGFCFDAFLLKPKPLRIIEPLTKI
jgi:hypothetical protein